MIEQLQILTQPSSNHLVIRNEFRDFSFHKAKVCANISHIDRTK